MSGFSIAAGADEEAGKTVAPISGSTPDIVAVKPLDAKTGGSAMPSRGAPVKFKKVSPSIIAEIGAGPTPARKPDKSKRQRFDPGPLVIRAGMIGGATPVHISAGTPAQQSKIADDGHQLSPESDSTGNAADQKKPLAASE